MSPFSGLFALYTRTWHSSQRFSQNQLQIIDRLGFFHCVEQVLPNRNVLGVKQTHAGVIGLDPSHLVDCHLFNHHQETPLSAHPFRCRTTEQSTT